VSLTGSNYKTPSPDFYRTTTLTKYAEKLRRWDQCLVFIWQ